MSLPQGAPTEALTIREARAWRAGVREEGQRLALTNGCFDLLHAGHVKLLSAARESADRLVVAINSDSSIKRLKGPSRPLIPQEERAELLLAFEAVDCVVIFAHDTPLETIVALRPDVLVKGADWSEDKIVGAKEVKEWGGSVVRVDLRLGLSTTTLIERIRSRHP